LDGRIRAAEPSVPQPGPSALETASPVATRKEHLRPLLRRSFSPPTSDRPRRQPGVSIHALGRLCRLCHGAAGPVQDRWRGSPPPSPPRLPVSGHWAREALVAV
jgi:hypothetical protein